jgi:type II secretory pathway pseudopilin PulG
MRQRGFTVIELLALVALLVVVGVVFWTQKTNIETAARDDKRKTSINAIYYGLEEVFYPVNKFYPKTVTESTLTSVDPALMKDPNGKAIGAADSDYRYEGKNCSGDSCKGYSLRSNLENEADYTKNSRNE